MVEKHKVSLSAKPMGSDIGHMKNVLEYLDKDLSVARRMVDVLIDDWPAIKARFNVAANKPTPTAYLLDTLKRDLHVAAESGDGMVSTGTHRVSEFAKKSGNTKGYW